MSGFKNVRGAACAAILASCALAVSASGQTQMSVSSRSGLTINDGSTATPYPAQLIANGFSGPLGRLIVNVSNIQHASAGDIDLMLVGPTGVAVVLMSDVAPGTLAAGVTLEFNDDAPTTLPIDGPIVSGMYRVTNAMGADGDADSFIEPAPGGPFGEDLSAFIGTDPNGTWRLYAVDDEGNEGGSIGGWSLDLRGGIQNFVVTNTNNAGAGSLRRAINNANGNVGNQDIISFAIPGAGPHTISPTFSLPAISESAVVNGLSQPGAACATWPPTLIIVLDGSAAGATAGLSITGGGTLVQGLVIQNFQGSGIFVTGGGDNFIRCNYLGTDVTGLLNAGNGNDGINIVDSSDNIIGTNGDGTMEVIERNLISGNDDNGVMIAQDEDNADRNRIANNYIGTDVTGDAALGNGTNGVRITASADDNVVGTNADGSADDQEGNIISGNDDDGVQIDGEDTDNNVVRGNRIGLGASGGDLGNGDDGIVIDDSGSNDGPNHTRIGTNGDGVVDGRERNIISGNGGDGVQVSGDGVQDTWIAFNYIGTNLGGTAAIRNDDCGVFISDSDGHTIGTDSDGSEGDVDEGNLISGNGNVPEGGFGEAGVFIEGSSGTVVAGNFIGTDVTGLLPIPNIRDGVCLLDSDNNRIGTNGDAVRDALEKNVISGNIDDGVDINDSAGNIVSGNCIGVGADQATPLGNGESGVELQGDDSDENRIGFTTLGAVQLEEANVIAFNTEDGVTVLGASSPNAARGNWVRGNYIHANGSTAVSDGALGIDLANDGVTENDGPGDPDGGANERTNFPFNVTVVGTTVGGDYEGVANREYTIDVYASDVADPSGNGEGRIWVGTTTVTTDGIGFGQWSTTVTYRSTISQFITTTATDPTENFGTSEFSDAVGGMNCDITCPTGDLIAAGTDADACCATIDLSTALGVSDACITEMGYVFTCAIGDVAIPDPYCFPLGDSVVTCTLTAPTGAPVGECTFTVRVTDDQAPTIVCPDDIQVFTCNIDQGNNGAGPANCDDCEGEAFFIIGVSDNCLSVSFECRLDDGTIVTSGYSFPAGENTVTCKSTDAAGNMSEECEFTVTVVDNQNPVIYCQDATIEVGECGNGFITASDIFTQPPTDNCPLEPCMGGTLNISPNFIECPVLCPDLDFSKDPQCEYVVNISFMDCAGNTATCAVRVRFVGQDCNENGLSDACDICTGVSLDCNLDGVPDECVCFWNNGMAPGLARRQDGEASHEGGGIPDGIRTADDFYLCPGQVHRLTAFTGQMITNSYNQNGVDLRRAKLLIYEDCNGKPVAEPFFDSVVEEIDSEIIAVDNAAGEFELVTYRFDLCDECLWLDGGKSYWVSLIGLTDHVTSDLSYWAKQRPRLNGDDRPIKGLPPLIAEGIPGGGWDDPFDYGPWYPVDDCCIGCVNMAFKLQGYSCKIAWDNGPADLGAGRGGNVSGAAGAFGVARSADQFVLNPCSENTRVCLIDTYIWTNCIPVQPFLELYDDNPCGPPELPRDPRGGFVTCDACKIIETGEVYVENGVTYKGYILRFTPDWELEPGRTYWLSSGSHKDGAGNFTGKAFFAYRGLCNEGACRTYRITPGHTRTLSPGTPTDWVATTRDFAFRLAVHSPEEMVPEIPDPEDLEEEAGGGGNEGLPAPACAADVDGSGQITVEDIFSFLSAWFAGCP